MRGSMLRRSRVKPGLEFRQRQQLQGGAPPFAGQPKWLTAFDLDKAHCRGKQVL